MLIREHDERYEPRHKGRQALDGPRGMAHRLCVRADLEAAVNTARKATNSRKVSTTSSFSLTHKNQK